MFRAPGASAAMTGSEFLALLFHLAGGAAIVLGYRRWQRSMGLATGGMRVVFAGALAGGMAGAALLHFFSEAGGEPFWQRTVREQFLHLLLGGRTWLGALLGGYAGVELVKRRLGITRSTGDGFALALPLGEGIGRLGCFFAGCCYGSTTNSSWAVWQHGALRHPAQLYSAAAAFLLFGMMWTVARATRGRWREGDLFKLYLLLYAASRFGLEFFRDHGRGGSLVSAAQWVCLIGAAALGAAWLLQRRNLLDRAVAVQRQGATAGTPSPPGPGCSPEERV